MDYVTLFYFDMLSLPMETNQIMTNMYLVIAGYD